MMDLNNLFLRGHPLTGDDCRDVYTTFAFTQKLLNYRRFNIETLARGVPLKIGTDIPDYLGEALSSRDMLGIANIAAGRVLYIVFKEMEEKKFVTFGGKRAIPYGMGLMPKFRYGDPIVVVEGLKDRDALSRIYPNTVAVMTAGISKMQAEVLATMTGTLIIAFDDDEAGQKGFYRARKYLSDRFTIKRMRHPDGVKDCGTVADLMATGKSYDAEYLMNWYQSELFTLNGR